MKKGKHSIHTILRNIVCATFAFWVLMAAPTGWLYDLSAGVGTEQGQWPSEGVHQLQQHEDVETFFWTGTPATVAGGDLAACPLARLRDVGQKGEHRRSRKTSVYVSEYIITGYPIPLWERLTQGFLGGGYYNRYYLIELGDSSWLCVYFDDYLTLVGGDEYPTGYVRYTTTEERRMLNQMQADYDVDPVYVLDMYRHGKANWMLDVALRLAVLLVAGIIGLTVREFRKKRRTAYTDNIWRDKNAI